MSELQFNDFLTKMYVKVKITEHSKLEYIRKIMIVYNQLELDNIDEKFFYNYEEIITAINDRTDAFTTKRKYYGAIKHVLNLLDDFPIEITEYYNEQYTYFARAEKEYGVKKSDTMTNDTNKWCSLKMLQTIPQLMVDDIVKTYKIPLIDESDDNMFYDNIFMGYEQYSLLDAVHKTRYVDRIQDFIISYFHFIRPSLRLELIDIPIFNDIDDINETLNYIMNKNGEMYLHLNTFKNSNQFGITVQKLRFEEYTLIKKWIVIQSFNEVDPNQFKLSLYKYNTYNHPKLLYFNNKTNYSNNVKCIIKKYINKDITCTTVRKIWETSILSNPNYTLLNNEQRNKLHRLMLHSMGSAVSNYNMFQHDKDPDNTFDLLQYIEE